MLDRAWPINSWLPWMRWPERVATDRAIDTASTNPNKPKAIAPGASCRNKSQVMSGADNGGNWDGICPTKAI